MSVYELYVVNAAWVHFLLLCLFQDLSVQQLVTEYQDAQPKPALPVRTMHRIRSKALPSDSPRYVWGKVMNMGVEVTDRGVEVMDRGLRQWM